MPSEVRETQHKARGRPRTFDREAALRRAMEVFWAKGFDTCSMADLVDAMGINSPSLYAAFGSKEDLYREAVELYTDAEGGAALRQLRRAQCTHRCSRARRVVHDAVRGLVDSGAGRRAQGGAPCGDRSVHRDAAAARKTLNARSVFVRRASVMQRRCPRRCAKRSQPMPKRMKQTVLALAHAPTPGPESPG
jgi:AcrR family transcriptional regulator